jgi:hypothetical protein
MANTKISNTAKLKFYNSRRRIGDATVLAERTGYSTGYVSKVLNKRVTPNEYILDAAYKISYRRKTNREMGITLGKKRGRKSL